MKLLILFPRYYYERKMSRGRVDVITHLAELTNTFISGPGWQHWKNDESLLTNIKRIMPDAEAILWYKANGDGNVGVPAIVDPRNRAIPTVSIYNEAWLGTPHAEDECLAEGTDLVIHHHLNDARCFGDVPAIHISHCADPRVFVPKERVWADRTIPLLVTGALNHDVYPLRSRIVDMIKNCVLPGKVLRHPGYRLRTESECRRQQVEYAKELGNAKLVVCCASKYGYGLAKYVEAAMAGACVIGDIPPDFEQTIGQQMVPLSNRWTNEQLAYAIETAIESDLSKRADAGQDQATQYHNIHGYCNRLLGAISGFIAARKQTSARNAA